MNVRMAQPGDADAIADVHIRSWQVAYAGLLDKELLDNLDSTRRRRRDNWERIISKPPDRTVTLVAEDDESRVVGFANCGLPLEFEDPDPDVAELSAIYLHPDFYGRGFGTALWEEAAAQLQELGFKSVYLWVFEDNELGRGFYDARGWKADGGYEAECMGLPAAAVRYRIEL